MNAKEEFSTRLRAAMVAAGLGISGTELERAFNRKWGKTPISMQAAWNWVNGKTVPRHDKLTVLAKLLKVDPHALLYGARETVTAADRRGGQDDLRRA